MMLKHADPSTGSLQVRGRCSAGRAGVGFPGEASVQIPSGPCPCVGVWTAGSGWHGCRVLTGSRRWHGLLESGSFSVPIVSIPFSGHFIDLSK